MSRLFNFYILRNIHFKQNLYTNFNRTIFFQKRDIHSLKNTFINKNPNQYRSNICNSRIVNQKNKFNVQYKRFNNQNTPNVERTPSNANNQPNSIKTIENNANQVETSPNGASNGADHTRKEKAIKRIKTRFQKFKGYLRKNKRVQNFKLYLNKNKRVQNLKLYLSNSKRFQRFRSYWSQKRQKWKGLTNKVRRREKLNSLKEKFKTKSLAFRLKALLTLKTYGKIGAFIYLSVYVLTLAGMNAIVFMNYLTSEDVRKALNYVNITSLKVPDVDSPFAKFTVAYIATKIVEPLRLIVSILLTIVVTKIIKR